MQDPRRGLPLPQRQPDPAISSVDTSACCSLLLPRGFCSSPCDAAARLDRTRRATTALRDTAIPFADHASARRRGGPSFVARGIGIAVVASVSRHSDHFVARNTVDGYEWAALAVSHFACSSTLGACLVTSEPTCPPPRAKARSGTRCDIPMTSTLCGVSSEGAPWRGCTAFPERPSRP